MEKEDAEELMRRIEADELAFISASKGINLENMFERIGSLLLRKSKIKAPANPNPSRFSLEVG